MRSVNPRCWTAVALSGAMLFTSAIAFAQPSPAASEPPEYYRRIEQAVHEYESEHWPEAYASFQQAHNLFPNSRTLRGLGLTAYKLRRYAESERHLSAALDSTIKPMTEAQRREAEELREWARRYIGHVAVKTHPPGAQALIDGTEAKSRPLALDVGEYVLTVSAPGYVTHRQRLVVDGPRELHLNISLMQLDPSPERAAAGAKASEAPRSRSIFASPWLWTAVGVVAAGAVVFAVTREGEVEQQPPYAGGATLLMGPMQ